MNYGGCENVEGKFMVSFNILSDNLFVMLQIASRTGSN